MSTPRGIRYIPAIDGLRAVAVIAVMLYHLGFTWIPGGFLGVDLFFVISGYVITRLLLDSIQRSGGLDLRAFYKARIRRLFPPLVFMIFVTIIYISIWAPETMRRFISDSPFALLGGMNWWLVFRQTDYFDTISRPPLLQHTWSLGVEAQFYLIWPLILLLVLRQFGKAKIPGAALIIAAFSGIALLLVSYEVDAANTSQVSHVYFGTDTHSIGLFLGAALAVSWVPQNLQEKVNRRAQDFIDGIGVIGFVGLLGVFLLVNESDPTLYKLAFPLAGIFGCAILTSIVHPASRFAPILSSRVAVWIGERSYAIYLWHWVVFQVTRPAVDLEGSTWALYALRILVVFALADISLRLVELPVRSGLVEYWFKGMKYRTKNVQRRQKSTVVASVLLLILGTSYISANAISQSDKEMAIVKQQLEQPVQPSEPTGTQPGGLWVTGDSVILGIHYELDARSPIAIINARVGRQATELIEVMKADKANAVDSTVIFNMGNNNKLTSDQVMAVFEEVKNQPRIIVVNTAVPRGWRDENNALIAQYAALYGATVVDWASISMGHPEYFAPDGVHLVPAGVRAYVDAITATL
ncbi:acyltransferase [Candidatus Planktophila vernalis]|uniref:Acyltransferase n=1 Tax=Candidatus Planktophila vernalis TaxID=1884907 RepID=A0A249KS05_9ACTN|nr:acyltransferase family protein [Candidatus Planktophila vernalis]ASY19580.1 acyltransferase [Candidatus Planktophila vernalis]